MDHMGRREVERDASEIIQRLNVELDVILSLIVRPADASRPEQARPGSSPSGGPERSSEADPGSPAR